MNVSINIVATGALLLAASACSSRTEESKRASVLRAVGTVYTVKDTNVQASFAASGTAEPLQLATLSTKLMGTVLEVLAREGDIVTAGQPLVRLDARDLAAKADQIAASMSEAEAMQREALTQSARIRALYADSAATRAQLEAAETGLARAEAGVRTARAGAAEIQAATTYSIVRAPFAGVVTKRFVDPGAFAAPGAPLMSVQDGTKLRIVATGTPDIVHGIRRGQHIDATVERRSVAAVVEGVVPGAAGNLYTINAIVDNSNGAILPGSTAALLIPLGIQAALVVPSAAVIRQGDLTGVTVRTADGDATRWVRLGRSFGSIVEVNSGLRAGDSVIVPPSGATTIAARN